ncbi:MAG: hypothetical protein Q7S28_04365 [bacterium]|nr:hypothetical protein [bacterium]
MRPKILLNVLCVFGLLASGCGITMKEITTKESFDLTTTGLITRPCAKEESERLEKGQRLENQCRMPDIDEMTARFESIRETTPEILGDTIEDVRKKGFSLYLDETKKIRTPNAYPLFGDKALEMAGISVGTGQPQTVADAERLAEFKSQFYTEVYDEKYLQRTIDRYYVNKKNSLVRGNVDKFVILFRNGRVLKRNKEGGFQYNSAQESGFLLGPTDLVIDGAKKGADIGFKAFGF